MYRGVFFSVSSVAEEILNTEVTEILRVLCVETREAQSTRRSWFCNGCEQSESASLGSPTCPLPICPPAAYGTTGSTTAEGCSRSWTIVFVAFTQRVP